MNIEPNRVSGRCLRQFVFYRFQALSSFVLFIAIGLGISAICALAQSPDARLSFSILLIILGIVIGAGQLLTTAFAFSAALSPIEKLFAAVQGWSNEVTQKSEGEISIDKIRLTLQNLTNSSASCRKEWPKEVDCLQNTFIHTLKLLESAWQKAEADAIMVGLGGVCAQVAHDMRSPATTMQVMSRAVLDVNTDAERKELSGMMAHSAERLNHMADELLTYRKAGAVELKPMDLSNVVRDICRELQLQAQGKNVQLELDIPPDQDFMGDADQLGRVVQNLVSNAIQAVEKQADGQVGVRLAKENDQIVLNIRDNGPGLPAEHVDKMFKTGFTTKGRQGNGLGLIYCANVVKGHGGRIEANNRHEGGAEIMISLPITH